MWEDGEVLILTSYPIAVETDAPDFSQNRVNFRLASYLHQDDFKTEPGVDE